MTLAVMAHGSLKGRWVSAIQAAGERTPIILPCNWERGGDIIMQKGSLIKFAVLFVSGWMALFAIYLTARSSLVLLIGSDTGLTFTPSWHEWKVAFGLCGIGSC